MYTIALNSYRLSSIFVFIWPCAFSVSITWMLWVIMKKKEKKKVVLEIFQLIVTLFLWFCKILSVISSKWKEHRRETFCNDLDFSFIALQEQCGGDSCFMISNHPSSSGHGAPEILYVGILCSFNLDFSVEFSLNREI